MGGYSYTKSYEFATLENTYDFSQNVQIHYSEVVRISHLVNVRIAMRSDCHWHVIFVCSSCFCDLANC